MIHIYQQPGCGRTEMSHPLIRWVWSKIKIQFLYNITFNDRVVLADGPSLYVV